MSDLDDLVVTKVREFVRAPAAYRETILRRLGVGDHFDRYKVIRSLNSGTDQHKKTSETLSILGVTYQVDTEAEYGRVRFLRFRPSDHRWAAYWVRGNGMKVYGDYEAFERDIVLLKTAI